MKKRIFCLMFFCMLFGINLTGIIWAHENDYANQLVGHVIFCTAMGVFSLVVKNEIFKKLKNMVEIEPEEEV